MLLARQDPFMKEPIKKCDNVTDDIDLMELRIGFGMTQAKMAETLGVSPNTLWKWEKNLRQPPAVARRLFKVIAWLERNGALEGCMADVRSRKLTHIPPRW